MDTLQKIDVLGGAAQWDVCRGCGTHDSRTRDELGHWIYPAIRPDGTHISMLKVLQSNVCERDCLYCANRSGRDTRRVSFTPDELARVFSEMVAGNLVQGLFLSSGVCGGTPQATERMLATVELIRRRYRFPGYVHLKILPGAEDASIEAALRMAQRVSVNLEAPNAQRMRAISPSKDFSHELLRTLGRADELRRRMGRPVSMTTQFVVGAANEPDREILSTSTQLYHELRLGRAYYSAFQPIPDTPLEDHPATPPLREHRLYQADFLLRQYGFRFEELIFTNDGNLPQQGDPKFMWALRHPEAFPVEVNTAPPELLLRIPGIGLRSVQRIVNWRKRGKLSELGHIGRTGADVGRAAPFILLNGIRPSYQLPLWVQSMA
jgi:predicted DNA-binding helix-hairpin-helix protein